MKKIIKINMKITRLIGIALHSVYESVILALMIALAHEKINIWGWFAINLICFIKNILKSDKNES